MRTFTHKCPQSRYFFSKSGHFFTIFEKGKHRPALSPLSSYTPVARVSWNNYKIKKHDSPQGLAAMRGKPNTM